jgi:hypothetical protein
VRLRTGSIEVVSSSRSAAAVDSGGYIRRLVLVTWGVGRFEIGSGSVGVGTSVAVRFKTCESNVDCSEVSGVSNNRRKRISRSSLSWTGDS